MDAGGCAMGVPSQLLLDTVTLESAAEVLQGSADRAAGAGLAASGMAGTSFPTPVVGDSAGPAVQAFADEWVVSLVEIVQALGHLAAAVATSAMVAVSVETEIAHLFGDPGR